MRNRKSECAQAARYPGNVRHPPDADPQSVGAIAHNLNEELTIIYNTVELMLARLGPLDPRRHTVIDLQHAAWRCALWTQLLSAAARRRPDC